MAVKPGDSGAAGPGARRLALGVAALLAGLLAGPAGAAAQGYCGERAALLRQLEASHREAPAARGLTGRGRVVELLTSDSGSWTIIVTAADGTSCLVAAGEAWEALAPPPPGQGS